MGEASEKLWFVQDSKIGQSFLLFFVRPAKKSEKLKSNVPKYTLQVFWVTTLVTEKKLSKNLLSWGNLVLKKREPRKASFPWDLGLLFGQPMRCALLLQNMKL